MHSLSICLPTLPLSLSSIECVHQVSLSTRKVAVICDLFHMVGFFIVVDEQSYLIETSEALCDSSS